MFGFKKKVRHMNAGNTTFYQFDRDTGFWGIPDISHEVVYDVAPDTPVRATHNSDGNRDTEFAFRPGEKNVIFLEGHIHGALPSNRTPDTQTFSNRKRIAMR